MTARESLRREVEKLQETIKNRRLKLLPRDNQEEMMRPFEAALSERRKYEALSLAEKIASMQRKLAEPDAQGDILDRDGHWRQLRRRRLEIYLMELEGNSADVIETARREADQLFRWSGRVAIPLLVVGVFAGSPAQERILLPRNDVGRTLHAAARETVAQALRTYWSYQCRLCGNSPWLGYDRSWPHSAKLAFEPQPYCCAPDEQTRVAKCRALGPAARARGARTCG
jgi:hypothetical protein